MKLETQIKLADAILWAIFGFLGAVALFVVVGCVLMFAGVAG